MVFGQVLSHRRILAGLALAVLVLPFQGPQLWFYYVPILLLFAVANTEADALPLSDGRLAIRTNSRIRPFLRLAAWIAAITLLVPVQAERPWWTSAGLVMVASYLALRRQGASVVRPVLAAAGSGLFMMAAAEESFFFLAAWTTFYTILQLHPPRLAAVNRYLKRPAFLFALLAWASVLFAGSWFYLSHFGTHRTLWQIPVGWRRDLCALGWAGLAALMTAPFVVFPSRAVWRWLLACNGLLLSFLLVESGLRGLGPALVDQDVADSLYLHNSDGHRDLEHPTEKPEGVRRVLVLGDSVTYGAGVPFEDLYARRLEALLNGPRREDRYEVLNISRRGWNAGDELAALKRDGLRYSPDLAVLGFVLNDAERAGSGYRDQRLLPEPLEHSLSWSYTHFASKFFCNRALEAGRRTQSYGEHLRGLYRPGQAGWEECKAAHAEMLRLTRERGVPFLAVLFPALTRLSDYPFTEVHEKVGDWLATNGATVVDLLPVYGQYSGRELRVSFADGHPNALAHQLAAEAIYEAILADPALNRVP